MDAVLTWLRSQWDRAAGIALIAVGAIAVVLGYDGVSDSAYVGQQLAYVASGGVGGLFLLGLGCTLLVSADLQDEWRKLDRIDASLQRLVELTEASSGPERSPATDSGAGMSLADITDAISTSASRSGTGDGSSRRGAPDRRETRVAVGMVGVGLVGGGLVLSAGWDRAASTTAAGRAFDGASLAAAGCIVAAVCLAAATFVGRRAVQARLAGVLGPLAAADLVAVQRQQSLVSLREGALPDLLLVGEGLTRYHRPGCRAIAGTPVRELRAAAIPEHLEPCGLCLRAPSGR